MRTTWIRFPLGGTALVLLVTVAQAQSPLPPGNQQRHSNQDNGGPIDAPHSDPSAATKLGDPGRPWAALANYGDPTSGDPAYRVLFDAVFTDSRRPPRELPIRVDLESRLIAGTGPEVPGVFGPPDSAAEVRIRPVIVSHAGFGVNPARGAAVVPEPASALALGLGLAVLLRRRRLLR